MFVTVIIARSKNCGILMISSRSTAALTRLGEVLERTPIRNTLGLGPLNTFANIVTKASKEAFMRKFTIRTKNVKEMHLNHFDQASIEGASQR